MKVAIVGAGLTGTLLACFLARRGMSVTLYERRPDPRVAQVERGRSINLAISERGLDALRRIGLVDQVMADALPMKGRMIHPVAGELDFQAYSASGERAINSISRGALNNALLSAAAEADGVAVEFEHRLVELDSAAGQLVFATPAGKVSAFADVVLGADGAGSAVREQLLAEGIVAEHVDFLDYGYKELSIPAADGEFALDPG
ncbi:MAG TPA: NAD(P)/FAD-dependent oxidoreductase, partial [Kribbella sp.]|nr:NAD(P)/FAD-dependent oxidoreductase [Kribbella sp.]